LRPASFSFIDKNIERHKSGAMGSFTSRPLFITFLIFLIAASGRCDNKPDARLATFQKFVNGEVPIKEAIVNRTITRDGGKYVNREWFRFGCQDNGETFYVQRLEPYKQEPPKLVPVAGHTICGASLTDLWTVSDRNIDSVSKTNASGSVPDTFGRLYRSLMHSALSLGLPRRNDVLTIQNSKIEWNSLAFTTKVSIKKDQKDAAGEIVTKKGELKIGTNGLPASIDFETLDQSPNPTVSYEYQAESSGIPTVFIIKHQGTEYRYEFLSLDLGTNDLGTTGGYMPSLFADMKQPRGVTRWTNDLPYTLADGKSTPAFSLPPPKPGDTAPAIHGTEWLNTATPLKLDELHGKVVLLDFWGQACLPCVEALPHTEALYTKFKDQGLMVIGVNERGDNDKRLDAFLQEHHVTFPTVVDVDHKMEGFQTMAEMKSMAPSQSWPTRVYYVLDASPSYVLVDKSGKLAWKSNNGNSPTESQIQALLEASPEK
jgi:peroxiredoxin